jgi:hypothetical protein
MSMTRHFAIALAASLLAGQAQAYEPRAPEVWERGAAWRASLSEETAAQRAELRQLLRSGDSEASLALLQALDRDPELPAPARERLLLDYVNELRQEPPRAVSDAVIEFLAAYPSTVLVAQVDHPRANAPLFNIRAATAGLRNGWTRQEAAFEGAALVSGEAGRLIDAFLASDNVPRQRGLIDALATAAPEQRIAIAETALSLIDQQPELIELAGQAALLNQDVDMLQRLLVRAQGHGLHNLLRRSSEAFDIGRNAALLEAALDSGSAQTAALAMAQLAPVLAGHTASVERLFQQLEDPATGSAAALALAGNPNPEVRQRLEVVAAEGNALLASRARLALQLMDGAWLRELQ